MGWLKPQRSAPARRKRVLGAGWQRACIRLMGTLKGLNRGAEVGTAGPAPMGVPLPSRSVIGTISAYLRWPRAEEARECPPNPYRCGVRLMWGTGPIGPGAGLCTGRGEGHALNSPVLRSRADGADKILQSARVKTRLNDSDPDF